MEVCDQAPWHKYGTWWDLRHFLISGSTWLSDTYPKESKIWLSSLLATPRVLDASLNQLAQWCARGNIVLYLMEQFAGGCIVSTSLGLLNVRARAVMSVAHGHSMHGCCQYYAIWERGNGVFFRVEWAILPSATDNIGGGHQVAAFMLGYSHVVRVTWRSAASSWSCLIKRGGISMALDEIWGISKFLVALGLVTHTRKSLKYDYHHCWQLLECWMHLVTSFIYDAQGKTSCSI